ncbi:hypothetical protein [Campylobacter phage CP81]|uniref:Lipoprotein n=2 Tax=Fletchervirus TaxID=1636618 RepID=G0LWM2_9CAUD|nr:Rz-like spanin [Campylobacter phage CP81]CBZ42214.1 hypothetical protein [Campylobacter phage CP81]
MRMKHSILLLIFSAFMFVGCSTATKTITITEKEYLKYPLDEKYIPHKIGVKIMKQEINGKEYLLISPNDFILIHNQYKHLEFNYNNLYNSIEKFNSQVK